MRLVGFQVYSPLALYSLYFSSRWLLSEWLSTDTPSRLLSVFAFFQLATTALHCTDLHHKKAVAVAHEDGSAKRALANHLDSAILFHPCTLAGTTAPQKPKKESARKVAGKAMGERSVCILEEWHTFTGLPRGEGAEKRQHTEKGPERTTCTSPVCSLFAQLPGVVSSLRSCKGANQYACTLLHTASD